MGLFDRARSLIAESPRLAEEIGPENVVAMQDITIGVLEERVAELELSLEDEGWQRFGQQGELEFSRGGLDSIIRMSRLMFLKSPLIHRAVRIHQFYVFGQAVEIKARDDAVNEVVQRFVRLDRGNRKELFGHQAQHRKEQSVRTDGNVFLVLFTSKVSGHVRVRSIPVDQIREIVTNPDDRQDVWFYKREWDQNRFNMGDGVTAVESKTAWYPDWRHTPRRGTRPTQIGGAPVHWQSPIYHVRVGGTEHMRFGVPEVYAALDWARAHKEFLENWATIAKALARFAWMLTGSKKTRASAKTKMETTVGSGTSGAETNPDPVTGAMAFVPEGADLKAMPKTGAQTSADDGRQLRLQVASAVDIPDTMLSGDPDMGTLATATTLDRPTELAMRDRQILWADVYADLIGYAVRAAIRAPAGCLRKKGAKLVSDPDLGEIVDGLDPTVDVTFPPILERKTRDWIEAIVKAATLDGRPAAGTFPPKPLVRELLTALGVRDVDTIVDTIPDDLFERDAALERDTAPEPTAPEGDPDARDDS